MLSFLLALVTLSPCAVTKIINNTDRPWGQRDEDVIVRAQHVCKTMYKPKICVKSVDRRPNNHFNVICGKVRK